MCKLNNYRADPTSAYQHAFQCLGSDFLIEDNVFLTLEDFVSKLYGQTRTNVDEARYRLFCTKPLDEKRLAPCRDALLQHAYRSMLRLRLLSERSMHLLALLLQTATVGE